ncbi:MAG: glycosyltransferase family 4 protein [Nitrospira sp.]|nr:glycosyltransferase family 4 protein [Nitrospira sp.]
METRNHGLRILFIAPAPRAGTVQYTHNLANALVQRGHSVTLVTGVGFELAAYPKSYHAMEVFDRYRPRPLRLGRFLLHCLTFRPQVIHLQGAQHPALYIILWALLRMLGGACFVYTPQDVLPNSLRPYHIRAFRFLYARMRHVFLNAKQNEPLVIEHFGVPRDRITVLPIADLTAFVRTQVTSEPPHIPADARVILCFGLIEPRKGIHTLLSAAPQVLREVPNALLLIVGKPLMDIVPLERQLTELGLQERVRLVPQYVTFAQMAGYFTAARVLVLPYESGWNSGVIASAFGFGKPVIATRVGGFDEVVDDERTGLLVPPKDPIALAKAIIRLLDDDALHARMVTNVQHAAGDISWDTIARMTEERYLGVLETGGVCAAPQAR